MAAINKRDLLNERKNRPFNSTDNFDPKAYKPNMKVELKDELISQGFEIVDVDVSLIDRDEEQPRPYKEVIDGIEEFIEQLERDDFRLYVFPRYHKKDDGRYMIITGERRTTAFKMAGRKTIQAAVKRYTEKELLERATEQFIENDQDLKKPLSIFSDAAFWRRFTDVFHGGNVTAAATARGKSPQTIYKKLKLLSLPTEIQDKLIDYKLDIPKVAYEVCSIHEKLIGAYTEQFVDYLHKVGATSYNVDHHVKGFVKGLEKNIEAGSESPAVDLLLTIDSNAAIDKPNIDLRQVILEGSASTEHVKKSPKTPMPIKEGYVAFDRQDSLKSLFVCLESTRLIVKRAVNEGVIDKKATIEDIEVKLKLMQNLIELLKLEL